MIKRRSFTITKRPVLAIGPFGYCEGRIDNQISPLFLLKLFHKSNKQVVLVDKQSHYWKKLQLK